MFFSGLFCFSGDFWPFWALLFSTFQGILLGGQPKAIPIEVPEALFVQLTTVCSMLKRSNKLLRLVFPLEKD